MQWRAKPSAWQAWKVSTNAESCNYFYYYFYYVRDNHLQHTPHTRLRQEIQRVGQAENVPGCATETSLEEGHSHPELQAALTL